VKSFRLYICPKCFSVRALPNEGPEFLDLYYTVCVVGCEVTNEEGHKVTPIMIKTDVTFAVESTGKEVKTQ